MFSSWIEKGLLFFQSRSQLQRRIISGGFWAAFVKAMSMPLNVAVVALLARLLTPEDMGVYFLAFSLVTTASSLGMLGMGDTMVRIVASSMASGDTFTARKVIQLSFSWGLVGSLIAAAFLTLFGSNFGLPPNVALYVALWGVSQTGLNLVAEALRSFSDIRSATVFQNRSFSNGVITLVLLFLSFSRVEIDLKIILTLIVIVGFGAVLFGGLLIWKKVYKETSLIQDASKISPRINIFSQALPVLGVTSMNLIRAQIGIWIVAALLSNEEIALYGSANRLVYLISVPLSTVVNALLPPIIAELYATNQIVKLERTVRSLSTLATIVALLVTFIFVLGGNFVLKIVFGEFYTKAWLVLGVLAFSQLVGVAGGSCGVTLIMTGHQKELMKITVISAALAVATTFLGAKLWGMVGVAAATVLIMLTQNVMMVLKAKQSVGIWTHVTFDWKKLGLTNVSRTI